MPKWNVNPSIAKSDSSVPPMAEDLGYDDDDFEEGAVLSGPPEEVKEERAYSPAKDELYSWVEVGSKLEHLKQKYIKARNDYVEALANYENLASMEKESV